MSSSLALSSTEQALRHSPIPAVRKIDIEETENQVILSGSVTSFYLKQLAQETVLPLLGPRKLVNRLVVVRS